MNVVPQSVIDEMLQHAADLASAPVEDLVVESAEEVTFSDGSLGCPQPGMMYTQALVDGYRVVIRSGDKTYDFRGSGTTTSACATTRSVGQSRRSRFHRRWTTRPTATSASCPTLLQT